MQISIKPVFISAAFVVAFALIIFFPILVVQAQSSIALEPTDNFAIPSLNGNVNFDVNGSYALASLENETWNFVNLQTNNSLSPLGLSVSVQNCNITITSCQTSSTTINTTSLRYIVEGQGKQAFKFNPLQRGGEWSVTFNRSFIGENEGWTLSSDGTLTVTKVPSGSNVSLTYFYFPDLLGGNGNNSNLPFYQKHSVIIATGVAVAITVGVAVAVTYVSKRSQRNQVAKENL